MSYGPPGNYGMPQPGAPPFPMAGGAPPPLGFDHVLNSPAGHQGGMPMPMAPPAPYQPMPPQHGPGMPVPGAMSYPTPGYGPPAPVHAPVPAPAPTHMGHYPDHNLTFGAAAMATTAFPGHYRAHGAPGGPPMPQPNQTTYYHQQTTIKETRQTTVSAPPPPSHIMASAFSSSSSKTSKGRPSVTSYSPFDGKKDAEVLRKAMKGLGCDNKAITYLLCSRTNPQRQRIKLEYKTMYGRDLLKDLKSELGGHFEDTVIALMTPPEEYDATLIRKSIKGLGTNEEILIEILATRTNDEIVAIKNAYKKLFERDMEKDIAGDTSGHFKKFLISLAQAYREETDQVDIQKARQSAEALYKAGEGRWGTDESKFNSILASKSFPQLRAIFDEYSKICKYDIEQSIKREMSGDLRDGMVSIVQVVRNAPAFFAQKLYKSMKGLGTDDKALIRVVVTRSEVDLLDIRDEFAKQYGQSLAQFIADDTKGNYKKILLQLIGESV